MEDIRGLDKDRKEVRMARMHKIHYSKRMRVWTKIPSKIIAQKRMEDSYDTMDRDQQQG